VNDPLREAVERLRAAGIESARADARILWRHAKEDPNVFASLARRRAGCEPVAYITGYKEFWSLDFEVGPGALIPRPETETLIEVALRELQERDRAYRVLDLGTGTACLFVAFLAEYRNATGVGLDSSEAALGWAGRNVVRHGLERRAELVRGSWNQVAGKFDLILSNPPYIPMCDLAGLPSDVHQYEPRSALDGGADGLEAYRAIAPVLERNLKPDGLTLLEMGLGQHHLVGEVMAAEGLRVGQISSDLIGIPRCMMVRRPKNPR